MCTTRMYNAHLLYSIFFFQILDNEHLTFSINLSASGPAGATRMYPCSMGSTCCRIGWLSYVQVVSTKKKRNMKCTKNILKNIFYKKHLYRFVWTTFYKKYLKNIDIDRRERSRRMERLNLWRVLHNTRSRCCRPRRPARTVIRSWNMLIFSKEVIQRTQKLSLRPLNVNCETYSRMNSRSVSDTVCTGCCVPVGDAPVVSGAET